MNLLNNPFYCLGVSTRDNNQKILIAAEEQSLLIDSDVCMNAKAILTNPRQRISAEISWLPGLAPGRTTDVIKQIADDPSELVRSINNYNPLVRCNISGSYIEHHFNTLSQDSAKKWIIYIAETYELIDLNDIVLVLNEDRTVAKVAKIQNYDDVETELDSRKQFLVSVSMRLIRAAKEPDIILADILQATLDKNGEIPNLLECMVEDYRLEVQKYLEQYEEKLDAIIENITKQADLIEGPSKQLTIMIDQFIDVLTQWDQIAQPIQLVSQSRGVDDDMSYAMARKTRDMSLYLANSHGLHAEAKKISKLSSSVFQELPQFSETLEQDVSALDGIISDKNKSEEDDEEWARSISLNIEFGKIFKDKLVITPLNFTFNNSTFPLSDITRLRWGTYTHTTNGIKDHTSHAVWVGTRDKLIKIECSLKLELDSTSRERFGTVINKLWRAVGVKLLFQTLSNLSNNKTVSFGRNDLQVNKDGIYLMRHKFFGADEPVHCRWEEFTYSGFAGNLNITSRNDEKVKAQLSYRDDDNTHILESLLDYLFKDGNHLKLRQGVFK